jgi:hypothetical protein
MPLLNTPFENNGIARLYAGMPSQNFSEAILAGCSSKLAVLLLESNATTWRAEPCDGNMGKD